MTDSHSAFDAYAVDLHRVAAELNATRDNRQRRLRAAVALLAVGAAAAVASLSMLVSQDRASAAELASSALDARRGPFSVSYLQLSASGRGGFDRTRVTTTRSASAVRTESRRRDGRRVWLITSRSWRMYDSRSATLTVVRWPRPRPVSATAGELDPFERVRQQLAGDRCRAAHRSRVRETTLVCKSGSSVTSLTTDTRTGRPIALDLVEPRRHTILRMTRYRRLSQADTGAALSLTIPPETRVTNTRNPRDQRSREAQESAGTG